MEMLQLKTSFPLSPKLNPLSSPSPFRTTNIVGSITMNGKERNLSDFRKLSAYIMQDNQLHANLTVEEAMSVATSLKLSTAVSKNEKMLVVSRFNPFSV